MPVASCGHGLVTPWRPQVEKPAIPLSAVEPQPKLWLWSRARGTGTPALAGSGTNPRGGGEDSNALWSCARLPAEAGVPPTGLPGQDGLPRREKSARNDTISEDTDRLESLRYLAGFSLIPFGSSSWPEIS